MTTILATGYSHSYAQSPFATPPETELQGSVSAAASERGKPIYAGSEIVLSGDRFAPGQAVVVYDGTRVVGSATIRATHPD